MSDERAEYLASGSGPEPADRERLDEVRDILGQETTWAEPPDDLADQVADAISEAARVGEPDRRRALAWSAAVVGIAAAVAIIMALTVLRSGDDPTVVALAGTDLEPDVTGQAAISETGSGWWIELDLTNLPAAEQGTYYEAWVWNDQGDGVSIGTFHFRESADPIVMWSGVDPANYPSVWVTLEDEDGDPAASDRVVVRGRTDDT